MAKKTVTIVYTTTAGQRETVLPAKRNIQQEQKQRQERHVKDKKK